MQQGGYIPWATPDQWCQGTNRGATPYTQVDESELVFTALQEGPSRISDHFPHQDGGQSQPPGPAEFPAYFIPSTHSQIDSSDLINP